MRRLPLLRSAAELTALVNELGFLPFFRSAIPGFSIEECTPAELWFEKDVEGPWEWKGPVICEGRCLYGKLFQSKAGYVSEDWVPDLINYRRQGMDFDERYDSGASSFYERRILRTLTETPGGLLSRDLRRLCGFEGKEGKGFDPLIARLQMQTDVCVSNFEYQIDRHGRPYGWGLARYSTPEDVYGADYALSAMEDRSPEDSYRRIFAHLRRQFPEADDRQIHRLIGMK